ncbi:hypothetical protein L7F22_010660 [Adiantum nelumboides]|nr:hypothetical protein [Adiantum nelumboides]
MAAAFFLLMVMMLQLGAMAAPCYPALFSFGGSLSDTGNGVLTGNIDSQRTTQRPYGETDPGSPAKRFSDGRLTVDFLATRVGLPFLNPSLDLTASFSTGANYAVSGATAEDALTLAATKFIVPQSPFSLDVQVSLHLKLQSSAPSPKKPSAETFSKGLYVIEIGSNDYSGALANPLLYPPATVISSFVPAVIAKIRNATEVLYASGARQFLLIGVPPIGCIPAALSAFKSNASRDGNGCIPELNAISDTHASQLLSTANDLRSRHADATYTFLDFNGAYIDVLRSSAALGFSNTLDACCGAGPTAPNRFNRLVFCSAASTTAASTLCPDPNVFFSWDGIHPTNRLISVISQRTFGSGAFLNPSNPFATCP